MFKKYLVVVLTLICICLCLPINTANNVYALKSAKEIVTINDMENFISRAGYNRSAGTRNEKTAASYLAEVMQSANLSYYGNMTNYIKEFSISNGKSQNVIGVKKSAQENAKKVIIGAHYDNAYTLKGEQTKTNGVYDNGSGVVCLIGLINEIASYSLPFDIIFVFYGAEETGLEGSKNFVNSLSYIDKKNVLLAFNFDSIGVGDYTYFFAGDSANSYKKMFKNNSYSIREMPLIKRVNLLANYERYAYSHIGLMSDNSTYLKNGIKCITFFSGNLSHSGSGFIESTSCQNIMHTKNDNLQFIVANYPNFISKINDVANLTIDVILNEEFTKTMEKKEIDLFFFNNKLVVGGIFLICFMFLVVLKKKDD